MIFISTASMSLVSNTFHEWIIETSKHNNIFLISTDSNVLSCGTERDDPGARMGSQVRSLTWPGDVQVIRWPLGSAFTTWCQLCWHPPVNMLSAPALWSGSDTFPGHYNRVILDNTGDLKAWVHTWQTELSTYSRCWLSESSGVGRRASSRDMSTSSFRNITEPPLAWTLLLRYIFISISKPGKCSTSIIIKATVCPFVLLSILASVLQNYCTFKAFWSSKTQNKYTYSWLSSISLNQVRPNQKTSTMFDRLSTTARTR